jgi:pyridinium-3,5-bisthiocarboxylic acid mononucleotide nickel chelatase
MNEKTLYLECYSGISGDMTVAALLDLGADQKVLLDGLNSLKVDGYRIEIGRRTKNSIDACDFNVILDSEHDLDHNHEHNHEHDHDHNQEDEHNHDHNHDHDHDHNHDHDHDHDHSHEHSHDHSAAPQKHSSDHIHFDMHSDSKATLSLGHHEHRNLNDINAIIEQSDITVNAKSIAKKIFYIIAVAEAKVHAKPLEEVHFHEVGAVDSIVDIVAAAICLDNLNIKKVIVSELYEGTGQIECQHGLLPIPVPAVAGIAAQHQLSLHITGVKGELVTPTGAGIVAAIKTGDTLPKEMKILKLGLGAGKRNYPGASGLLRAMLIEDTSTSTLISLQDNVWVLEANLDDCTGEALAYAMELLFENGARDVYYTPIYMKKNRPAYLLGVICSEIDIDKMEEIIFTHTTTIGIRRQEAVRTILPREQKTVVTSFGNAQVKVCTCQQKSFVYPEYESVKQLCQASGLDYMTMYHLIQSSYHNSDL